MTAPDTKPQRLAKFAAAQETLEPYGRKGVGADLWHFNEVPASVLRAILVKHPELGSDAQNDAPTFAEMLAGVGDVSTVTFHGYCVTVLRDDQRITLEGFNDSDSNVPNLCCDLGWRPDELSRNRAWWD